MEAYRFETTVLEDGVIKIPEISKFENQEVEIIVMIKQLPSKGKKQEMKSIDSFLKEWTGFAKGIEDPDKAKYNYLMEKYK